MLPTCVLTSRREPSDKWNLLGTYQNPRRVRVTNAANGVIIVDAVKFERGLSV